MSFTTALMTEKIDLGYPSMASAMDYDVNSPSGKSKSGRDAVVETVLASLAGGAGVGAILVGEYGVGKSFVARQTIDVLGAKALVMSLRCSSSTATIDYGALGPLLNELGDVCLEDPLVVLRTTAQAIKERAKGRQVVLFVDNVGDLDDRSAMVVTQLAVDGVATLLAACESFSSAPAELVGLWRDGLLQRVDVRPFSEDETRQWLRALLQLPVSEAATMALWDASGGNPRLLHAVVEEQIESGTLIRKDDVWVLTGAPFACTRKTVDTVLSAVGSLSVDERQVLEVLALSGRMAINQLMAICESSAVDSLQRRGYLALSHGESGGVQLANLLLAEVLNQQMTVGRSRELYQLATEQTDGAPPAGTSRVAMAVWAINCGYALDLEETVASAREATNIGHPEQALEITDALQGQHDDFSLHIELTRARMSLGELGGAKSIIFSSRLHLDQGNLAQQVDVLLLRSRLTDGRGREGDTCRAALEDIRSVLDDAELSEAFPAGPEQLVGLREQLDLALAERAVHEGRYAEIEPLLRSLNSSGQSLGTRRLAGLWLIEMWTLMGQSEDATRLAEQTEFCDLIGEGPAVSGEPSGAALIGAVAVSLMAASTGAHQWNKSASMFNRAREVSLEELVYGLNLAYHGCSDKALSVLVPAASQLERLGEFAAASLAHSASGYVNALKGEDDTAAECLRKGEPGTGPCSRLFAVANAYFQVMAAAEMDPSERTIVKCFALADDERRFRTIGVELAFVCAAMQLGNVTGAQRLIDLAEKIQGEQARICAAFGRGLLAHDTAALLAAADKALTGGDHVLARDVSRAALKIAKDSEDKAGMRAAQQMIRNAILKLGRVKPSIDDGQVLTLREQEIALQAAEGASNKAIASKMHISVRTVEGHLYQVYSKLQVTSRAELREILA